MVYMQQQSWMLNTMRSFTAALLLILGWLQYSLWFGTNGYQDFSEVRQEIDVQQAVNSELQQRNDEMYAEIDDLRQGLDAIEERARHELGMIKEDETFYRIIDTP